MSIETLKKQILKDKEKYSSFDLGLMVTKYQNSTDFSVQLVKYEDNDIKVVLNRYSDVCCVSDLEEIAEFCKDQFDKELIETTQQQTLKK